MPCVQREPWSVTLVKDGILSKFVNIIFGIMWHYFLELFDTKYWYYLKLFLVLLLFFACALHSFLFLFCHVDSSHLIFLIVLIFTVA